jgi:hypothetical protein
MSGARKKTQAMTTAKNVRINPAISARRAKRGGGLGPK